MTEPCVTIIVADDHPVVRSGLRFVLERERDFRVLHEAQNGDVALQLIHQSHPDAVILDVEMPVMDGFAVARAVQEEDIPVNLIFMTMHSDERTFSKAMECGVRGFVLKENAVADIVRAVRMVMEGKYFISSSLSDHLMQRKQSASTVQGVDMSVLTPTERTILGLIAEQKTTKTIADELFISPKTVEKHRSNICSKLNLRGAYALLKFALENKGLLS